MTTTPGQTWGTADPGTAGSTSSGTATEQTKHVAGVAKDEARQVAGEAKEKARNLIGDMQTQVTDESRTQRDRLVHTLHELSDELRTMADNGGRSGMATELVRQVADRASNLSSTLEGHEPGELVDQVRSFARRRPGAFMLGAVVAGVVAGRLTRGGVAASQESSQPTTTTTPTRPTVPAQATYSTSGYGSASTAGTSTAGLRSGEVPPVVGSTGYESGGYESGYEPAERDIAWREGQRRGEGGAP